MKFEHIPVQNADDVTRNFEQLQREGVFAGTVAIVYRAAELSVPNETFTLVKFDKVVKDPGSNFSLAEGLYVVPAEGYYHVAGTAGIENIKAGVHGITSIVVNGTEALRCIGNVAVEKAYIQNPSGILFLKKGDKVELKVWHASELARVIVLGEAYARMSVVRVA